MFAGTPIQCQPIGGDEMGSFEEFGKESFYTILKMKIVSTGIRTTDSWVKGLLSTTELFDLLLSVFIKK